MILVPVRDDEGQHVVLAFEQLRMSGSTRSMPSISSLGNATPQSRTTILPWYSTAVMFLPISPRPPSGTIVRRLQSW